MSLLLYELLGLFYASTKYSEVDETRTVRIKELAEVTSNAITSGNVKEL